MRILIVTPFRLDGIGGVCTSVVMLRREFQRLGHDVTILLPGDTTRVTKQRGAEAEGSVYAVYLRSPFVKEAPLKGLVSFVLMLPITLFDLHRFLRRGRFDAVSVQYPLPWMFYFAVLRRLSSWHLVATFHGNDAHDLPSLRRLERSLVGLVLRAADTIVAVSRSLIVELERTYPRVSMDALVIPAGFPDHRDLSAGMEEPEVPIEYILTVGQLIHRKGIDIVIRALSSLRQRGALVELVIVGDGPEREALSKLARDLNVADQVHLLGTRSHEKTLQLFDRCLFFVLGSRAEGLPLVIVEAMAFGKPVIATAVDGIPELVEHDRSGLLIEPENATLFGEAIERLSRDCDLRRRMGAYAKQRVIQEYSWRSIAERYSAVLTRTAAPVE